MTIVLINVVLVGMIGFALYRLAHVLDLGREIRADLGAFTTYLANPSPVGVFGAGPVFKTLRLQIVDGALPLALRRAAEIAIQQHYGAVLSRLKVEMRLFPFVGLSGSLIALNIALGDVSQSPDDPMQLLTAIPVAMQSSIAACLCMILLLLAQIHLEQRLRRLLLLVVQAFPDGPVPPAPRKGLQSRSPIREIKEVRHVDA